MRVLIVCNSSFTGEGPYVPELVSSLEGAGIEVSGFNDEELVFYHAGAEYCTSPLWTFVRRFPYLRRWFRRRQVGSTLKELSTSLRFDVLNIHYVKPEYSAFLRQFRLIALRLIVTVWGSDFYRMDSSQRARQRAIYDEADCIMFGNPQTRDDFVQHYGAFADKTRICSFGLRGLDLLDELASSESPTDAKRSLGLPTEKLTVCCGSNAYPSQNHLRILEGVGKASAACRAKIHVVLPLTYPALSASYRTELSSALEAAGVSYSMLELFLTKKEVARLRMASDVMVLMQTTDQLSASLQEHLYAGSVVIAGDWLPYVVFENEGIFFLRAGLEDVRNRISDVVENIERFRTLGRENRERVYRFSNWKSRIQTWKEIYES